MARKSKKRSAEQPVEELDEEIRSPSNRSRPSADDEDISAAASPGAASDNNDGNMDVREEEEEQEASLGQDNNQEEEEEEEEESQTQSSKAIKRTINVEGRPAEAGVIKKVVCENFMCHQKLTVELSRNVNFIHGANGSGKSAILAAIQICLGANARRTNRARNLKDLVRKEAGSSQNPNAKVRVTLLNGGEDAFKPDSYGREITVERVISLRGGYNGYRLLDEDGKEVSRKKQELDDMLDYLNIQVDNPVAILDQEEAKKFLTGKATDKHAFFMKATELSRIDKTFAAILDREVELEATKKRLSASLEAKYEVVKAKKKVVDLFQGVEELEKKRLGFEVDYSWAFFNECKQEYNEALEEKKDFEKKYEQKKDELTQAEEQASGANDTSEEKRIRDKMDELKNEASSAAQLKRELEKEAKTAYLPIKNAQRELKALEGEKKAAGTRLIRAQKILKETRDEHVRKMGTAESDAARRAAELSKVEDALAKAKSERDGIKEAVAVAYRGYEEQEPEFKQAQQQTHQKTKQRDAVKYKLQDLSSANANDPAAIFGPKCSAVCKLVEDARRKRRFRGEVLGPIGAFLKIAPGKEKYAELAEMSIGNNTLDRFILTDNRDRQEFENIRKQAKCIRECGLFLVKVADRYNIPPPPAGDIETVASVLVISNDIVFNTLVDNLHIDQRALAPSKQVSEDRLLISDGNGGYKIRGIINNVSFLPKGDNWTTRNGAIALSSNDKKASKKIGVDRSQAIEETKAELSELEEELKILKKSEADAARRREELKLDWNGKVKAKRNNEDVIMNLTTKKESIENEMATTANTSIDTTEMEEDVAAAEDELQRISSEREKLMAEIEKLQPAADDAKRRLEEVDTRNGKILVEMNEASNELEACLNRQTQTENDLEKKRSKVKKYSEALEKLQSNVDEKKAERDRALEFARKLTLRKERKEREAEEGSSATQEMTEEELESVEIREPPKASAAYEAKLKRVKDKIAKEKERRDLSSEDREAAIEKYLAAKEDIKTTQEAYQEAGRVLQQTQDDLRERQKRWNKLRKFLERMTDNRFDQILQLNKACGELEFSDNELHLVVQKDIKDPNSQTRDVKALSGGERSYATISLLLALGESLETPFRVLDEFDVFLDLQARKLTIQTLIHVAKQMEHRQFIFITPQDLSSVKPDDKVKIFRLKPPQRNERASGMRQSLMDDHISQSQN